ncbi:MAG: hypothetical protein PHI91_00120 [Candidatus Pacebacteria bacterium]|nr:hypothetical protein [Candidatus Paceibacterota bacterium]MDD3969590.1 hypothetical protein [Candidatus Paceibacterota bacterium]
MLTLVVVIIVAALLFISFWKVWVLVPIIVFLIIAGKHAKKPAASSH